MVKDSPAPFGPEPPSPPQVGAPRSGAAEALLPPAPRHRGTALAVAPSGRIRGGVRGGCHIASASQPRRGDSIKVFAAEPVKESAIHSTGWAEPGVAWAPPGTGTSQGRGGGRKMGFRVFFPFETQKGKRVGKFIFQITP